MQSASAKLNAYNSDDFVRNCVSNPITIKTIIFAQTPIMNIKV